MKWITREGIRVNRTATCWLIRRFLDPEAEFIFVTAERVASMQTEIDAPGFDAPGATYPHKDAQGFCSFAALVHERLAHDPALLEMARIVQAADIKGQSDDHPAAIGLQLISRGFPLVTKDDQETAERAGFVYDALYASIKQDHAHRIITSRETREVSPVTLEGQHVRLEPLSLAHEEALIAAASDGELWNSTVTIVPSSPANMADYIQAALDGQTSGKELPFVIIRKSSDEIVGTTRFYEIRPNDRAVAIGYTWLAKSAQRTAVNTESKLLLLTHAFERWRCNRVELITDVLNEQSRAAILRIGAKQEGILRSHLILPSGRIRDSVLFSIIKEEWPEVKSELAEKLTQTS